MSNQDRDPRQRRRKRAGHPKAGNELRQTYKQQDIPDGGQWDFQDGTPGEMPDAAVVRNGEEEMILFPSYARKHIKRQHEAKPGTTQQVDSEGHEVREQELDGDENVSAVVDIDVRGWIFSPHEGLMSRKQRLFVSLARQLVGVSAPSSSSSSSTSSRDSSPQRHGFRERAHLRNAQHGAQLAAKEEEESLCKVLKEAKTAAKDKYSERPIRRNKDNTQLYGTESTNNVCTPGSHKEHQLSHSMSKSPVRSEENIKPLQKRAYWPQPCDMSPAELAEANARLTARLRHFLAVPVANTPVSVLFSNEEISRQRTIYTDPSGHFSTSAALDFVPTHVQILAFDKLSATAEVIVTESAGISVISDIDDTIKHSAIHSGAREIFRNALIRDLGDLTIEGVKDWYDRMAEMGATFHYVSNSPWQLFPVISKYFSLAELPLGSFHLKQYSGMLQGIFEPVAERKKVTLDKIARDFPNRKFILIGDSGETDLEVYTEFVLENPGQVVAVFIRDVTTSQSLGFLDPLNDASSSGERKASSSPPQWNGSELANLSGRNRTLSEENDPELNTAITASIREMEEVNLNRPKSVFPHIDIDHPYLRPKLPDRHLSSQSSSSISRQTSTRNVVDLSSDDESDKLRGNRAAAVNAVSYVASKASLAWQHAPSLPYLSNPITSAQTLRPSHNTARQGLHSRNTGSNSGTNAGDGQHVNKKEQLWHQRWLKANNLMLENGVVLRSWRTGSDAIREAEQIIKNAKKNGKSGERPI